MPAVAKRKLDAEQVLYDCHDDSAMVPK